jgi:hypothetical protein
MGYIGILYLRKIKSRQSKKREKNAPGKENSMNKDSEVGQHLLKKGIQCG